MITQILNTVNTQKRRTGNILIIILLVLVPIMGFGALAVDYGLLVNDKNHLQRACDASALGAAQELKLTGNVTTDTNNATTEAIAIAAQNGVTVTSSDISFTNNYYDITVTGNLTRNLFFARVLGIAKGNVGASATAGATVPPSNYTQAPYVVPIGLVLSDYDTYKYTGTSYSTAGHTFTLIRHNKQALGVNDLALFDLRQSQGKSGKQMRDQLTGVTRSTVTIYDGSSCTTTSCQQSLNSAGTSQGSFYVEGLDTLISNAAGAPWHDNTQSNGADLTVYNDMVNGNTDYSNPRVINLIVTNTSDAQNGNSNMPVLAFVPVYILGYTGNGKNSDLNVTFLFLPTQTDLPTTPDTSGIARVIQLLD